MLNLTITVKDNKEVFVNKRIGYMADEYLDRYMDKKIPEIKEKYIQLIKQLDTDLTRRTILAKEKNKNSSTHWEIGKKINTFIIETNKEGINIENLINCISKSIEGHSDFWIKCIRFYNVNPNGEYKNFAWKLSIVLANMPYKSKRDILVYAYQNRYMGKKDIVMWKDLINIAKPKKLHPSSLRKKAHDYLVKGWETEESLAKKLNCSKDGVRGRITELRNDYGYDVIRDVVKGYHIVQNEDKRLEKFNDILRKIEDIKRLLNQ
jgi:biotin operon repressor